MRLIQIYPMAGISAWFWGHFQVDLQKGLKYPVNRDSTAGRYVHIALSILFGRHHTWPHMPMCLRESLPSRSSQPSHLVYSTVTTYVRLYLTNSFGGVNFYYRRSAHLPQHH